MVKAKHTIKKKSAKANINFSKKKKSKINLIIGAIIGIIIICAFVLYFNKAPFKDIAATVNNEVITIEYINEQYGGVPEEYRQFITKEMILNQSIDELLLLQEAKKQGISVTAGELSNMIDDSITQSGLSKEEFEKTLDEQNLTMEFIENYYEKQLIINRLLNKTVLSKIVISISEVKEYYNNNENEFITPEQVRARHILVNSSNEAESILKELKDGADFIELAKEKSTCPSASQGGDLGYFSRGQMIAEFEDSAFALKVGELSPVVETQFGYHIIKLLDKKPETVIKLEDAMQDIEEKLKLEKQNIAFADYLVMLREKADIKIFEEKETLAESEITPITASAVNDECITKYDITKDTVIFVYSDSCPHCQNMKPLIRELEEKGYNFYWATGTDSNSYEMLNECFADVMSGYVPQFICPNGIEHTGGMPIEDLKEFADKCRA
ncbi:MAG: peptidylprolyl isomerase [Nanoarchaeota archaeon]|nr:peptidylprolyl isomerase [Nanoarchaeota archaeon]